MGSAYSGLSWDICAQAWVLTQSVIKQAHSEGVTNKHAGMIVVGAPRIRSNAPFGVFYSAQVDAEHPSAGKYREIATAKAMVTWETGLSSRQVQQDAPHLFALGMTKWGGAVIRNGLVVAFSGVEAVFDEAIAETMHAWLVALCRHEMTRPGGVMSLDTSYIGEVPDS